MPKLNAPLNDSLIKALKPKDKIYKKSDGENLYIFIKPNGVKVFQFEYKSPLICFLVANLWIYLFFKFNILSFDAYKTIYFDTKKEIFFIGRKKLLAFCKKNKNHMTVKKAIFYYNLERCITYLAVVFAIIQIIFGMESQ